MSTAINYAPFIAPVTGDYKLCCVALKWEDNAGASLDAVSNCGKATAANYTRLSNGQFNFTPSSYSISVPFKHDAKNVGPATDYAKKILAEKGIQEDGTVTYAVVNNNAGSVSYTGGDTSHILNALTTTFYHEIGRTDPLNLGSSGAYKDGKYVYQADGTSFMSHFSSDDLTASQLYYLGWLPNTQVALYNDLTTTVEYTLDNLDSDSSDGNVKAVLILGVANKPLFFSRPTFKDGTSYALHLASGSDNKGSERLDVFGKTANYNGLTFTQISESGTTSVVSIGPQLAA